MGKPKYVQLSLLTAPSLFFAPDFLFLLKTTMRRGDISMSPISVARREEGRGRG